MLDKIRDFRNASPNFPMPSAGDCAAFAVTELGEVVDAMLRNDPEYIRNNAKLPDIEMEVGDAFLMIGSAIIAVEKGPYLSGCGNEKAWVAYKGAMKNLLDARVRMALGFPAMDISRSLEQAGHYLDIFCKYVDIDPEAALDKSINKLMEKHGK